MTQGSTVCINGRLTILARLGQILFIFFLTNLLFSPFPTKTSVTADVLTTIVRILFAGFIVGMIGRRRIQAVWWYRLWAGLFLVIMVSTVALDLAILVQGQQLSLGVIEVQVRDTIGSLLALWLASSIAKRRTLPPSMQRYAGFWKRFAASFIDSIITGVGAGIIGFVFGFLIVEGGELRDLDVLRAMGNVLGFSIWWIYFAVMESSPTQGTLGKMALGIKVTDLGSNRISFGKATGRCFGKIVSALILLIGFIMIAFTEKKQGLHDIMAGCLVIEK